MLRRLIVIICLTVSSQILAQTDPHGFGFDLTSRYISGTIRAWYGHKSFGIYENHLYAIYGNTLAVFNINDPEEFVQVGFVDLPAGEYNEPLKHSMKLGNGECLVYSRDYDDLHLNIFDISDPATLETNSSIIYEGYDLREDVLFDDLYVYRRGQYSSGFQIDSLGQSGSVTQLADLPIGPNTSTLQYDGHRVVVYRPDMLYFVDVSDRSHPFISDSMNIGDIYYPPQLCGDYLLISEFESPSRIIDVSEGSNLQTLVELPEVDHFFQSAMVGDMVYSLAVRGDTLAFDIIDMSDPSSPEILSSVYLLFFGEGHGLLGSTLSLEVSDGEAILSGGFWTIDEFEPNAFTITDPEDGFKYVDLSDQSEPLVYPAQRGRALHMAHSDQGLWLLGSPWSLLNVDEPSYPFSQGWISPPDPFFGGVVIENNTMFIQTLGGTNGEDFLVLESYDTTSPLVPVFTGSIRLDSLSYWSSSFVVHNSMVYLANDESLYTIDFTNPDQPELTSVISTGRFRHFRKSNSGGFLYGVVDDQFILTLIDITNPQTPLVTGTFSNDDHGYVVNGNVGFSARRSDGHDGTLRIHRLDVSDPQSIVETGSFLSGTDMWVGENMILDGLFLYVWSMGSIEVFDVSIAGQETKIARYNSVFAWPAPYFDGYGIRDVFVEDGTVYLLNDLDGLHILTHSTETLSLDDEKVVPSRPKLYQNYPNPFNPTTTISYELPEASEVDISIYDIQGRLVTRLIDGEQSTGSYKVDWSGLDREGQFMSTGVYLCKIVAGDYTETIKMVYLR